jgi:AcrR family transcriptional regulator
MATPARATADVELLRPPQQTRSRESLDRVLQAGQELLEEKGWEGFTVQEVSKRAKVSVGSIYARAPNKDALILAVYDYAVSELREERASFEDPAMWEGLSLAEVVAKAMREMVGTMMRHEPILRVIMVRAATDPVIRERGAAQILQVANQFQKVVLGRRDEITQPDPDRAVEIAFRMAYATIVRRVTLGPNFGALVDFDDDALVDEMAAVMTAYLTAPKPAKGRRAKKR